MTREEALLKIGELVAYARTQEWDDDYTDAFKTLEQEPILDKIRAEIETQEKWLEQVGYYEYNVDIAFQSIKLVLAESER